MANYDNSSPVVTNSTFSGNFATWGGGMYNYNSSPTVTNSIISSNQGGGIYAVASSPTIDYNDVWNNSPDDYFGCSAGPNDISQDPLFVNPAADDYHLQAGSPGIDVGDNSAPSLPSTDFEGDPRIVDGDGDGNAVVDMGVDEYVPPPPPIGGVGGEVYPINKVSVLAPWLGLILILVIGGSGLALRRRRAH